MASVIDPSGLADTANAPDASVVPLAGPGRLRVPTEADHATRTCTPAPTGTVESVAGSQATTTPDSAAVRWSMSVLVRSQAGAVTEVRRT